MPKSNLLWALGINGEGSSRVTFAFIKYICGDRHTLLDTNTTVIYTSRSTLDQLIAPYLQLRSSHELSPSVNFIRLPKFTRNYLFHYTLKLFCGPLLRYDRIVVFDDFPFFNNARQVLYFHQPNLLYNNSPLWTIKRFFFRFLLTSTLTVFIQTSHMRKAFISKFGNYNFLCFLHHLN